MAKKTKKTKTSKTARKPAALAKRAGTKAAAGAAMGTGWGTKARRAALLKPAEPKAAPAKRAGTKSETVLTMIATAKGATIEALMKATDWQAHTLRAFLSRARAAGTKVESDRADGVTTYRVAGGKAAAKSATPAKRGSAKRKAEPRAPTPDSPW